MVFINSGLMEFHVGNFMSIFFSNRRLQLVLDGKSLLKYPIFAGVTQGPILISALSLLYINYLVMLHAILLFLLILLC